MLSKDELISNSRSAAALSFAIYLRFVLFWILLFTAQRFLFNLHYLSRFRSEQFSEYFRAYYHGFRLDMAMIGYLTLGILPFYLLWAMTKDRWKLIFNRVMLVALLLLVLFSTLIHCGELVAYDEWNHKLTTRVFTHLGNPDEVFRTATWGNYFYFFSYALIQFIFALLLTKLIFGPVFRASERLNPRVIWSALTFFVLVPISLLLARGGWQQIPININAAMFSSSPIVNDMSTNSTYYFLHSLNSYSKEDLEKYLGGVEVSKSAIYFMSLENKCDTFDYFLDTIRPNLVFVVLESWVAGAISHSGEVKGTTPNFDQMISEGLYFSRMYATAGTSEIGNASIFSGYPGLPQVSLTLHQDKSRKIPALNQTLKDYGYTSSYLFGGDLKYGNIGAYFLDHNFDKIKDESNFSHITKRGKLNIYDTDLLEAFIKEVDQKKAPFISVVFTGSTHSPWDIPKEWQDFYSGEEAGIMNTIHYADHALGLFIQKAKERPWYNNTLFVFVADHGRTYPGNSLHHASSFFRIPLLFWGPALKEEFRGQEIDRIGSQTDIVTTILSQMQISSEAYSFSRNLMCPNLEQFAIYTSSLGYGKITPEGDFFYNMLLGQFSSTSFESIDLEKEHQKAQMYLRTVWERFKAL